MAIKSNVIRPRIPHACCEHGSHLATCWLVFHMVVQLPAPPFCRQCTALPVTQCWSIILTSMWCSCTLLKRGREIKMSPTAVSWWSHCERSKKKWVVQWQKQYYMLRRSCTFLSAPCSYMPFSESCCVGVPNRKFLTMCSCIICTNPSPTTWCLNV